MDNTIIYKNKNIFYRTVGKGSPVIFIHGFGEDGTIWNNVNDIANLECRFIIPDLPGSGHSEMIDDMSMEGLAEVVWAIHEKENENHREITVIGHSMGGYIALAIAEKYPRLLNGLGLFHSTAYPDSEEKKAVRRKGIEFIKQHGAFEFLKTTTPNLFSPKTRNEKPELVDEFIGSLSNFSIPALVSYYEAMMMRPNRLDVLKKANFPVFFTMGEFDNAVPLKDGLQQCHLPEKSYIHILHNSAHLGMLEEPQKSNFALNQFLQHSKSA
jgi:pimeloyl-ACP methyl ester carboxylesterase